MKLIRPAFAILLLLPLSGWASDEIQGSVADILSAIRNRLVGKLYSVHAEIAAPPDTSETRFVVRDRTGSIVIRRDLDWPAHTLTIGDTVRLTCEINSTASTPAAAYFRDIAILKHNNAPSHANGNWLVVTGDDESVRVTALPGFLTTTNVLLFLIVLFLLAAGILSWNAFLHRLVDRRSRELTNERLASFSSCLKVEERTRLAVELHDTIAQMLKGVSLEIDAARDFAKTNSDEMDRHLNIAAQTLASCQADLRNCLWDLRNQTLDDISMNEAIRRTLSPHLNGAVLTVRFNVERELFSDNTTLALLRIIRELSLNAVRHGKADIIRIAGCIAKNEILFSITDNGCGFDTSHIPGVEQGHFGLQGVVERVETLGGILNIDSSPGNGTRVDISIPLSKTHSETHEENQDPNR